MARVRDLLRAFFLSFLGDAVSPPSSYLALWILSLTLTWAVSERLARTYQLLPTMLMPLASAMR